MAGKFKISELNKKKPGRPSAKETELQKALDWMNTEYKRACKELELAYDEIDALEKIAKAQAIGMVVIAIAAIIVPSLILWTLS